MALRVGINGFGRMGRLVMRAAWDWPDVEFVHINEPAGDCASLAHLLSFDSVHGRWRHEAVADAQGIAVDGRSIGCTHNDGIADTDWSQCDLVLEASGAWNRREALQAYLDQGVERVVVTAPVRHPEVLNIVLGVNDALFDPGLHPIVTAASCTTNCLAPVVKVILDHLGIERGTMTTVHDITNTQSILDSHHRDLRRARASSLNLIPTTTGSARAITDIFPALAGRLDGHAVRVPLANASLTDCVFQVSRATTAEEVNGLLRAAAAGELAGILGYEERPLVSTDYRGDPRSAIIDAPSTLVVDATLVKIYAWYDNEWGYTNRTVELALKVGRA